MKRKRWLAVAAGGVAAAALVGAGVVMAQTPTPGSGGSGPSFLDRVAQKLGIESSKLQDAVTSAANDQSDAEVQSGKLSQQQADKLKQRVQNGEGPWFNGPAAGGGPSAKGIAGLGFALGKDISELATFLGMSTDQLKTELGAPGATLATVASNHGKTRDQLKTFITNTAKNQLDQFRSHYETQCMNGCQSDLSEVPDLRKDRDSALRKGTIAVSAMIGGSAIAVGGIIWGGFINRPHRVVPRLEVAPTAGGAAASASWRF